ncbi:hypothetical protein PHLCEN_2v7694 [Hermanssonia centrifuga]|uniref:BTB domain-containing protein n=1 Tax=Hermanssonia centrifuga TaxID=98765 RepID=A0A2R6NVS3_9APHY|nr:hypothetical protein PHLCEN_2v7694 [Hermanssonia centrifuga]
MPVPLAREATPKASSSEQPPTVPRQETPSLLLAKQESIAHQIPKSPVQRIKTEVVSETMISRPRTSSPIYISSGPSSDAEDADADMIDELAVENEAIPETTLMAQEEIVGDSANGQDDAMPRSEHEENATGPAAIMQQDTLAQPEEVVKSEKVKEVEKQVVEEKKATEEKNVEEEKEPERQMKTEICKEVQKDAETEQEPGSEMQIDKDVDAQMDTEREEHEKEPEKLRTPTPPPPVYHAASSSEDESPPFSQHTSSSIRAASQRQPSSASQPKPRPKPRASTLVSTPLDSSRKRSFAASRSPTFTHARLSPMAGNLSQQAGKRSQRLASQKTLIEPLGEEDGDRYTKRPRKSTHSSASQALPASQPRPRAKSKNIGRRKRHAEYWLLDGSVVLQIQNTLFRLHRSRLVQQSAFFARLFRNQGTRRKSRTVDVHGSGSDEEEDSEDSEPELLDNCPVYKVTGVSVQDFEAMLIALDNAISYIYETPPFFILARILRAARALQFQQLDTFATLALRKACPSSLSHLTATPAAAAAAQRIPFANEVIVLARRCKMPELLKRAFYELARSAGLGQDEEDTGEEEDGEVDAGGGGGDGPLKSSVRAKERMISRRDLVLLIKTREQLALQWLLTAGSAPPAEEFPCPLAPIPVPSNPSQPPDPVPTGGEPSKVTPSSLPLPLLPPPPPPQTSPAEPTRVSADAKRCAAATANRLAIWDTHVTKSGIYEECMYDPLCGLERIARLDWEAFGYCKGCVEKRREAWRKTGEKIWGNLDLWLELIEPEE